MKIPDGDIQSVPIAHVRPNPWKMNSMEPLDFNRLVENIRDDPSAVMILVRPTGASSPPFNEIIDGEYRWKGAREAGAKNIRIQVLTADDITAKRLTVNLNVEPVP